MSERTTEEKLVAGRLQTMKLQVEQLYSHIGVALWMGEEELSKLPSEEQNRLIKCANAYANLIIAEAALKR